MKKCGIIVEYNPLHNGHLYHLEKTKEITNCDCLIAVMSGNFTQRGEVSIINKFEKTLLALKAGVDIVIELPYIYAVGNADLFSFGAISLLNQCGIDSIVFGSETNDREKLMKIAGIIDNEEFNNLLKTNLQNGLSYPKAAHQAITTISKDDTLTQPNDILGIQYIRQIQKINPRINFFPIKRVANNYHDEVISNNIASATSIRKGLKIKTDISATVPLYTYELLQKTKLHFWNDYFPYLKYMINVNNHLHAIHDVNEGIENAIKDNISDYNDFETFVNDLVTKRYTKGKIQRILCHILNNVTKSEVEKLDIHNGPKYLRILGFKQEKANFLKDLKKNLTIPLITNITKETYDLLSLDLRTSSVYHLNDKQAERKIPIIL